MKNKFKVNRAFKWGGFVILNILISSCFSRIDNIKTLLEYSNFPNDKEIQNYIIGNLEVMYILIVLMAVILLGLYFRFVLYKKENTQ